MSSVWRPADREMPRRLRSSRSRFAFDAALDLRLYFAFHVPVHRLSLRIFLPRFSSPCSPPSVIPLRRQSPSSAFRKLKSSSRDGGERIVKRCQLTATQCLCPLYPASLVRSNERERTRWRERERKQTQTLLEFAAPLLPLLSPPRRDPLPSQEIRVLLGNGSTNLAGNRPVDRVVSTAPGPN